MAEKKLSKKALNKSFRNFYGFVWIAEIIQFFKGNKVFAT